jgi:hypothetical protein
MKKPQNHAASVVDPLQLIGRLSCLCLFGIFVIVAVKYVDAKVKNQSELDIQDRMIAESSEQRMLLEQYRSDEKSWSESVATINAKAITEEELPSVQDRMIELAKEHGCTLKKVAPRGSVVRPLIEKDPSVQQEAPDPDSLDDQLPMAYDVREVGLSLSSEGDLTSTLNLLDAVRQQPWFVSTRQMVIRRDPAKPSNLTLEFEMNFNSLQPQQKQDR